MKAHTLSVVSNAAAPEPPYPSDTRAKGWRFELDYERIEQSDTWALATPEMRPWLLMIWLSAWRQSPCGSLPASDELIAARIGMPARQFAAHRDILLRGWWLAADGRMYHPTMTERVQELLEARAKEAARQRGWRQKNQGLTGAVTRDAAVTNASVTTPVPVPEPVPVPVPGSSEQKKSTEEQMDDAPRSASARKPAGPKGLELLLDAGVERQVALDWIAIRSRKRLPLTATAWAAVVGQAESIGLTPGQAVKRSVEEGWAGFKADWVLRTDAERGARQGGGFAHPASTKQSAIEARNAETVRRMIEQSGGEHAE